MRYNEEGQRGTAVTLAPPVNNTDRDKEQEMVLMMLLKMVVIQTCTAFFLPFASCHEDTSEEQQSKQMQDAQIIALFRAERTDYAGNRWP